MQTAPSAWWRPAQFGGNARSGHSTYALRMTRKGWLESRRLSGGPGRPNNEYRLTEKGEQALVNHHMVSGSLVQALAQEVAR